MMDGRRRQWIAWDVYFNDGTLGHAIRERFGICGWVVFRSFMCACKKSSVQGKMTYSDERDALAVMGLAGLELKNEAGDNWTLDEFWTFLGQRKQIRRTRRGRVTDVFSTRWEHWQNAPGTAKGHTKTGRSGARNTNGLQTNTGDDNDIDPDPDIESDNDPDSAHARADTVAALVAGDGNLILDGEGKTAGLARLLAAACIGNDRAYVEQEAMLVVALCKPHAPFAVLEAAVQATVRRKDPAVLPRLMISDFKRECRKRGLPAPLVPEPWAKTA